jgi:hypothetical protein
MPVDQLATPLKAYRALEVDAGGLRKKKKRK